MKIDEIRDIISTKLFNILCRLRIETIEDIAKIDLREFSKVEGVGRRTIQDLSEVQKKIYSTHLFEDIVAVPIEKPKSPIIESLPNDELRNVEFKTIERHLPRKLYTKLHKNNIHRIGDLCKISLEEFIQFEYVGKRIVQLLKYSPKTGQ